MHSLDSKTGDIVVTKRRVETSSKDAEGQEISVYLTVQVRIRTHNCAVHPGRCPRMLSLTGRPDHAQMTLAVQSVQGEAGLMQSTKFLSGSDLLGSCDRFFISESLKTFPAVPASTALRLFCDYVATEWSARLTSATAADEGGCELPENLFATESLKDTGAAPPEWLRQLGVARRYRIDGKGAVLTLNVEVAAAGHATPEWALVDSFSTARSELRLLPSVASATGDVLVIGRATGSGRQSAQWELQIRSEAGGAGFHEKFCFSAGEFSLYESLAFGTQWFRPLAAEAGGSHPRVWSSSTAFREHLVTSKWVEYLERPHSFKSGDEIPDVLACGGSAKQCIASGLAMGMTVPIPGFVFIGGLGGAIVATPPVQAAVARYISDNLSCRLTVRDDSHVGDLLLVKEINHMASKWRVDEILSYKAGDFEVLPHETSFNGEQLRLTQRVEVKGRVCRVEELYVLDRQGRGFNIHQRVTSGPDCIAETNRYYEYDGGSVLARKSLLDLSLAASEQAGAEQFEWVEQNVETWLSEHQDEVLAESKALAIKAAENSELVESSRQLAALAETLVNGTSSFTEIQQKAEATQANSTINMKDALTLGETLLYELAHQTSDMQGDQKDQA
eukprot:SAG22_NODE_1699_length_3787_cov_60.283623_1_plen_617_part_10